MNGVPQPFVDNRFYARALLLRIFGVFFTSTDLPPSSFRLQKLF
jgi:hypothetical protein